MFSIQTSSTTSTDSTEQSQKVRLSHRKYEKAYRREHHGAKRYEPCVPPGMAAKRAARLAKKLGLPQPLKLQPEPLLLPVVQMILEDQTPIPDPEKLVQHYTDMYGDEAVLTKKFGPRTVVACFPEPSKTAPHYREVWQLEDGKKPRRLKASYGNKSSINKLEESDWKWMVLKDFPDLIRHLVGASPLDTTKA